MSISLRTLRTLYCVDFGTFLLSQMSKEWETVVCGQTKDQRIMTERARQYLRSLKSHTPSLALALP